MKKIVFVFGLFFAALQFSGCGWMSGAVYRPDIMQGNVFDQSQIESLYIGMPREQVRYLLGTPSVNDPFSPEIDIYVFYFKSGEKGRAYQRRMSIVYQEEMISAVEITPLLINEK